MSNYKQTSLQGESWVRSKKVIIDNPLNGIPNITFVEEQVVNFPDEETMSKNYGNITREMTPDNQGQVFNVLDPETGEVVGQATYGYVYALLHSLYYHCAGERDVEQADQ